MRAIITVIGQDRIGIIARVTGILAQCRVLFDKHSSWNAVRSLHYVRKTFLFQYW